jgi:hypothetical protein
MVYGLKLVDSPPVIAGERLTSRRRLAARGTVRDRRLHVGVLAAGLRVAPANLEADIYRAEHSARHS